MTHDPIDWEQAEDSLLAPSLAAGDATGCAEPPFPPTAKSPIRPHRSNNWGLCSTRLQGVGLVARVAQRHPGDGGRTMGPGGSGQPAR